jgi:G3E family GTPase
MLEIFILAGFLGSGKTTLLRKILAQTEALSDTAVIVNEFGQVGFDGRLLERHGLQTVELVNGCICCSLVYELSSVLSEISSRKIIRRVFIEATGLAEPGSLISLLQREDLGTRFIFRGIISVLDARLWNVRGNMGPFFMNQLKAAAVVVLNKIDLVAPSESARIMRETTRELTNSRVLGTSYCDVDLRELMALTMFERGDDYSPRRTAAEPSLASEYSHVLFDESRPFDRAGFETLLRNLSPAIVRVKGLVRYPDRTLLLNVSFGEISWEQMPENEGTCLEFIGKGIDEEQLVKELRHCIRAE